MLAESTGLGASWSLVVTWSHGTLLAAVNRSGLESAHLFPLPLNGHWKGVRLETYLHLSLYKLHEYFKSVSISRDNLVSPQELGRKKRSRFCALFAPNQMWGALPASTYVHTTLGGNSQLEMKRWLRLGYEKALLDTLQYTSSRIRTISKQHMWHCCTLPSLWPTGNT